MRPPPPLSIRTRNNRGSQAYTAMSAITKTMTRDDEEDQLDALLKSQEAPNDMGDDERPPELLAVLGRGGGGGAESKNRPVYFLAAMNDWIQALHADTQEQGDAQVLLKYWDQWRFPKKARRERRDSLYYRKLKKEKAKGEDVDAGTSGLLSMNPSKIASELSLQELNMFKSIPRKELFNRNFMEVSTGANFQCMVSQFNTWCAWVLASVLEPDEATQRALVIAHFIEIAEICHLMNNFNSSYAIVGGLNHPQVARLRVTWELVPKKSARKYEKLLAQWDVSGNYRRYRDVLKTTSPPCVPYLGLLGKDMWSIEENSKTLLTKPIGLKTIVNFKKLKLLWQTITFVDTLQGYEYPGLEEDPTAALFLARVRGLSDADAKKRSQQVEPREAK